MFKKYFQWLQKDVPTGEVEKYPDSNTSFETNVPGIYVIGDLTGIPLLKLASESGAKIIRQFQQDIKFQEMKKNKTADILDFLIIGAGPAGIVAGIEGIKFNFQFKILESSKAFNTIYNFPKGKQIYTEPKSIKQTSQLKIEDGTKESLLTDLQKQIEHLQLPLIEGVNVDNIVRKNGYFEIQSKKENFKALRVILAIGKSGNSRKLKVKGEDLSKVFNRLIDPADAIDQDVLVVGGGDSALETAIATAEYAKSVTLSYRKDTFSRPKEGNVQRIFQLEKKGEIQLLLETHVNEITKDKVFLKDKHNKTFSIKNSMVFVLIGKQLPLDFFKKINVKIEGTLSKIDKWMFFALLSFSGIIYFGKSSVPAIITPTTNETVSWSFALKELLSVDFWGKFLSAPFTGVFFKNINQWNWTDALYGITGYLCFIGFIISGFWILLHFFKSIKSFTSNAWKTFKYTYFIGCSLFFLISYWGTTYLGLNLLGKSPGFWYTFLYSLTILLFGLRRMHVKPTLYIKRQTWTLIWIQILPLFLLPEIILPILNNWGLLGSEKGFLLTQIFPDGDFSHAYRFILAWPLNIYGLFADKITTFWLIYTLFFTFGIILFLVYRWGKGAYCSWICSCGALAETLGDEYRTLSPHGPKAKKWENIGQWVLLVAFIITGLKLLSVLGGVNIPMIHTPRPLLLDFSRMIYSIIVDVIFAGVLGVGVYFFLSGRIWCRFFCPLAALMHIYTRFSKYRIFSDKKKCISCNICTKVCHMGIDVMGYANKGVPMNDVECVRCSACIVNCPMDVLYFGTLPDIDTHNTYFKHHPENIPNTDKSKWYQGF